MSTFYKRMLIFYIVTAIFLVVLLGVVVADNVTTGIWTGTLMLSIAILAISTIAVGLLFYYKNIVISISFEASNTIIKTNSHIYSLPSTNFIEVNDSRSLGRTFILYKDGNRVKRFVFQKQYSPFKTYSLDLDEMKKHMVSAIFKES